ncbi:MAG: hypothetical protein ABSD76_04985 [Terriglobales bacterium]|jgi:hypothetical protein
MDKKNVKKNVKCAVKHVPGGWKEALSDAEEWIKKAHRELADWKAVAAICRRRVAENAPWPNDSATRN